MLQSESTQGKSKILATNSKFVFVSYQKKLILHCSKSFEPIYQKQVSERFEIGCLQYGTGIVAVCRESMVYVFDLAYNREIFSMDTYQKLVKSYMIKNLLIYMSEQRVIIYDMQQKTNLLYVPIKFGSKSFLDTNYYNIQIFYNINQNVNLVQSLWRNKTKRMNGLVYEKGVFFGNYFSLVNHNVVSIYEDQELLRVVSLKQNVTDIIAFQDSLFVRQQKTNRIFRIKRQGKRLQIVFNKEQSQEIRNTQLSALWIADNALYNLCCGILRKIFLQDIDNLAQFSIFQDDSKSEIQVVQNDGNQTINKIQQGQKIYDMFNNATDELDLEIKFSQDYN